MSVSRQRSDGFAISSLLGMCEGQIHSQLRLGTISDYSLFANDWIKVPNLYFNFVQDPRGIKVDLSG